MKHHNGISTDEYYTHLSCPCCVYLYELILCLFEGMNLQELKRNSFPIKHITVYFKSTLLSEFLDKG